MDRIQGIVTNITYQNEDNGFTVLHLQKDGEALSYTCVGVMPTVVRGESIALQGEWDTHKKFGAQFTVKAYEIVRPTTLKGIEQLLSSGLINNIGEVRAKKIIDTFGIDTLDVLDNSPERLSEVAGIGKKTAAKINAAWGRQKNIRSLMMFLQEFEVSLTMAVKIYKAYGEHARQKISENPYALIDDVWGVGFIKADKIAEKMGFAHDSYKRIRAGLTHIIHEGASEGHSYLPFDELVKKATEILDVKEELVTYSLDHSLGAKLLLREEDSVYLPTYYNAERSAAELLSSKLISAKNSSAVDTRELDMWIAGYQVRTGWTADPKQVQAVREALVNKVFLLTGGPGTGKTTILQVIVSYLREHNRLVSLAAPTGRAAQRMGSISGLTARTIHRLLEFRPGGEGFSFGRSEQNPIDADIIILDEVSMVDILLMRSFLNAVRPETALIFVGDDNQLPSVGAGNVLGDMIASGIIPHVHLTTVFRQAAASRIVTAAHEIIHGEIPSFANRKEDNCFFMVEDDPEKCLDKIVDLISRRLPSRYGFNPFTDIQVLSPMHKGVLGTQNINALLQAKLNGKSEKITRGQTTFSVGDKVMQIRNNYDMCVFNGDIGIVIGIIDETGLSVSYDGTLVTYEAKDLDELVPAYCISIHKSQGCEFKAVIITVTTQHFIMLQRNLIYTALTRARELCILLGSRRALSIAVNNTQALSRYSHFDERLRKAVVI